MIALKQPTPAEVGSQVDQEPLGLRALMEDHARRFRTLLLERPVDLAREEAPPRSYAHIAAGRVGQPDIRHRHCTEVHRSLSDALAAACIYGQPALQAGLTATLTVVQNSNGSQVAYNGHLLYQFANDTLTHLQAWLEEVINAA